jgi:hypothetical protein
VPPELIRMDIPSVINSTYFDTRVVATIYPQQFQNLVGASRVVFSQLEIEIDTISMIPYGEDFLMQTALVEVQCVLTNRVYD